MLKDPLNPEFVNGEVFQENFFNFSYPEKFDKIITSPPFINSTRFLFNNRIRLWFDGWSYKDQVKKEPEFIESKGIEIFNDVLHKFSKLLKNNGYCIMHVGIVKKLDMGLELSRMGENHGFQTIDIIHEDVSQREKFGIKDQGATHKHQFLIMQKIN
jgi:hypothetical protein